MALSKISLFRAEQLPFMERIWMLYQTVWTQLYACVMDLLLSQEAFPDQPHWLRNKWRNRLLGLLVLFQQDRLLILRIPIQLVRRSTALPTHKMALKFHLILMRLQELFQTTCRLGDLLSSG